MKEVLKEEWDNITVEEINIEIAKLPDIMESGVAGVRSSRAFPTVAQRSLAG